MNGRQVPILHTVSALESMRNRGITLPNAIRECVDNSWEWIGPAKLLGTAQIRVHLQKEGDLLTVSVLDNGMGIADHVVEAPDGQARWSASAPTTAWTACRWPFAWGTHQSIRFTIGRFGFGLRKRHRPLLQHAHACCSKQKQVRGAGLTSTFRPCSLVFRPNNPGPCSVCQAPALLP